MVLVIGLILGLLGGAILLIVNPQAAPPPILALYALLVPGIVLIPVMFQKQKKWRQQLTTMLSSSTGLGLLRKAEEASNVVKGVSEAYDAYNSLAGCPHSIMSWR